MSVVLSSRYVYEIDRFIFKVNIALIFHDKNWLTTDAIKEVCDRDI